jgi:hypothetical protein
MGRTIIAGLLLAAFAPYFSYAQTLESGVAITDAAVVAHLQETRFSAGALLFPKMPGAKAFKNDNLFKGPLKAVGDQLMSDIASLPEKSLDEVSRDYFLNDSEGPIHRFSANLLNDRKSGFVLTGITNRMDRAYRTVDGSSLYPTCGEIRFLYRFTYDVEVEGREVASRLPFTMAIVLNTRDPDEPLSCATIAQRWQQTATKTNPQDLIAFLDSTGGPLTYLKPSQVDRIEVNLQLFRVPAGKKTDFGGNAEYLLRIFRRGAPGAPFKATPLENELDRDALLSNTNRLASFKKWLFGKPAMAALDHGILDIPSQYLTDKAISVSPASAARSGNQPFFGVVSDDEMRSGIMSYEAGGTKLTTIKSVDGFKRRLNDLSCTGCHQTRAIAGFHFPGADPDSEPAANAVHVPGSAHFFGDVPRRKAIVASFAAKVRPDFSRSFAARPDEKFRKDLAGTQIFDGWGSSCYIGSDQSFVGWTCAVKLECKILDESTRNPGMGTCVTAGAKEMGDPLEFGAVHYKSYGDDSYKRDKSFGPSTPEDYRDPPKPGDRNDYVAAHQGFRSSDSTGGFPSGMLRIAGCKSLPSEAVCGRVASTGFNDCIAEGKPFTTCLQFTTLAGLRACDRANPCREDYICTAPYKDLGNPHNMGTCIPPYFMFQFRVDGHPKSFAQ